MKTLCVFDDIGRMKSWVSEWLMYAPSRVKFKTVGGVPTQLMVDESTYHLWIFRPENIELLRGNHYDRIQYYCKDRIACQRALGEKLGGGTNYHGLTVISGGKDVQ